MKASVMLPEPGPGITVGGERTHLEIPARASASNHTQRMGAWAADLFLLGRVFSAARPGG